MADRKDIVERIKSPNDWPSFENAEHLDALDEIADNAMQRHSVDGYLAAILIYHQLAEETLRVLIRDSQFLIEASIYPWKIEFPSNSRQTFGQVLEHVRRAVEFDQKREILALADELNKIRIEFVHGLTKKTNVSDIEPCAQRTAAIAERIHTLFDEAHDWFRLYFKDLRKEELAVDDEEGPA